MIERDIHYFIRQRNDAVATCMHQERALANSAVKTVLTAAHWGPMLVETDGETVLSSRGALPTNHPNSLQTVVRDQVHSKTRVRFLWS
jgi:hypothetical protein